MAKDNPTPEFKSQEEALNFLVTIAQSFKGRWVEVAEDFNDIAHGAGMVTDPKFLESAIMAVRKAKIILMLYLDGLEQTLHQLYLLSSDQHTTTQ